MKEVFEFAVIIVALIIGVNAGAHMVTESGEWLHEDALIEEGVMEYNAKTGEPEFKECK